MVVMFLSMWTTEAQKISVISNGNFRRQYLEATFSTLVLSKFPVLSVLSWFLVLPFKPRAGKMKTALTEARGKEHCFQSSKSSIFIDMKHG